MDAQRDRVDFDFSVILPAYGTPRCGCCWREDTPTNTEILYGLGPSAREYVEGIMTMTPEQLAAAFGFERNEPGTHPPAKSKPSTPGDGCRKRGEDLLTR